LARSGFPDGETVHAEDDEPDVLHRAKLADKVDVRQPETREQGEFGPAPSRPGFFRITGIGSAKLGQVIGLILVPDRFAHCD
jgi:hypothetical protein